MFNNLKYKIKDTIINPVIDNSISKKTTADNLGEAVTKKTELSPISNIKAMFVFYKGLSFFGKIYELPFFVKTLYLNLKKIYNE
jgi:hypothetical protein